jgi:hypothetical protein
MERRATLGPDRRANPAGKLCRGGRCAALGATAGLIHRQIGRSIRPVGRRFRRSLPGGRYRYRRF